MAFLDTARMLGGALRVAVLDTVAASRTSHSAGWAPQTPTLAAGFHAAYAMVAGTLVRSAGLAWLLPRPARAGRRAA